mgnify:CR=1 FL=1
MRFLSRLYVIRAAAASTVPVLRSSRTSGYNGLGFAFQGKDFKTVKLALISEKSAKSSMATASGSSTDAVGSAQIKGRVVIGGYDYLLKVTMYEGINIEADMFSEEIHQNASSSGKADSLPVPIGHVSLNLSEPEPGNPVILGSLRLNDEKVTAVNGEFELYLNDITRKQKQKGSEENDQQGSGQ